MDERTQALGYAAGRAVLGAALLAAPGRAGRPWIGPAADTAGARVALAALGIRDLALGVGTLRALRAGDPARRWLAAGAASDAVDCVATLRAGRSLPLPGRLLVTALAGAAAAQGARLTGALD